MRGKYKYLISELGVFVFCYIPALIKIAAVSSFKIRRLIDYPSMWEKARQGLPNRRCRKQSRSFWSRKAKPRMGNRPCGSL